MAKAKTAPAINEDDDAIASIFGGQPLQSQAPIVDNGATPGSPVAAPAQSDDEALAAIFSGQAEQSVPEAPKETMTGKLLKGGVEAFQKYNPLGLADAVKMGQDMVGNVVGGVNEFGQNVMEDPAAVASTMAGGALQGAADLGDQIYNTGSALAGNPVVSATMPHMQALGRAGDMLGLPKSIDMSGAVAANQPLPRPVGPDGKPTMQHLYDASQMIGQLPAAAVGLTPAGLGGKIVAGAGAGLVQGGMGQLSQQMKQGMSPDFLQALIKGGVPAAWLGGAMGGALHLPAEAVKGLKGKPAPTPEPEIKVTRGTGNNLPVHVPGARTMEQPLQSGPLPLHPDDIKTSSGTGNQLPAVVPKGTSLIKQKDLPARRGRAEEIRDHAKETVKRETGEDLQIGPDERPVHHMKGPIQDVIDAEIVSNVHPDVLPRVKERLKGIAEADGDSVGGLMEQAFKDVKESNLPPPVKAKLYKEINKAYEANPDSIGYQDAPAPKAEPQAKAAPEPAARPTAREIKDNPEYHHEPGKKAGWRKVPKDGGGSQNVLELVDKNGNPIAGPNKGRTRITWKDLNHLDNVKVSDAAHDAFQAARAGKKQPTVAKAAEVKPGEPVKYKTAQEALKEGKKKQANADQEQHFKERSKLEKEISWREKELNETWPKKVESGKMDAEALERAKGYQTVAKAKLQSLTDEYAATKNLSKEQRVNLEKAYAEHVEAELARAAEAKEAPKAAAQKVMNVKKGSGRSQSGAVNLGMIFDVGATIGQKFGSLKLKAPAVKQNRQGYAAQLGRRLANIFAQTKSVAGRKAIADIGLKYTGAMFDLDYVKQYFPTGLHLDLGIHRGQLELKMRNAPDFLATIEKRDAFESTKNMTPNEILSDPKLKLNQAERKWASEVKKITQEQLESIKQAYDDEVTAHGDESAAAKFLHGFYKKSSGGKDVRNLDLKPEPVGDLTKVMRYARNAQYDNIVAGNLHIHSIHAWDALLHGQAFLGIKNFWAGAQKSISDPKVKKFVTDFHGAGMIRSARNAGSPTLMEKTVGNYIQKKGETNKLVGGLLKVGRAVEGSWLENKKLDVLRAGTLEVIAKEEGMTVHQIIDGIEKNTMPEIQQIQIAAKMHDMLMDMAGYKATGVTNRNAFARANKDLGEYSEAFTGMRQVQTRMLNHMYADAFTSGKPKDILPVLTMHTTLALISGKGTLPKAARVGIKLAAGGAALNEIEKHLDDAALVGKALGMDIGHLSPDGIAGLSWTFDSLSRAREGLVSSAEGGLSSFTTLEGLKKHGIATIATAVGGSAARLPSLKVGAEALAEADNVRKGFKKVANIDESTLSSKAVKGTTDVPYYTAMDALQSFMSPTNSLLKTEHAQQAAIHRARAMDQVGHKYGKVASSLAQKWLKDDKGLYTPDEDIDWNEFAKVTDEYFTSPAYKEWEKGEKLRKEQKALDKAKEKTNHEHHEEEPTSE